MGAWLWNFFIKITVQINLFIIFIIVLISISLAFFESTFWVSRPFICNNLPSLVFWRSSWHSKPTQAVFAKILIPTSLLVPHYLNPLSLSKEYVVESKIWMQWRYRDPPCVHLLCHWVSRSELSRIGEARVVGLNLTWWNLLLGVALLVYHRRNHWWIKLLLLSIHHHKRRRH